MLEGVETYGGRVGGVRGGWMCVGEVEKCGGRGGGECECERGGDVWEGVRCVGGVEMWWRCVTEVEKCGGRGGGEYRRGGDVWEGVRCVEG